MAVKAVESNLAEQAFLMSPLTLSVLKGVFPQFPCAQTVELAVINS